MKGLGALHIPLFVMSKHTGAEHSSLRVTFIGLGHRSLPVGTGRVERCFMTRVLVGDSPRLDPRDSFIPVTSW